MMVSLSFSIPEHEPMLLDGRKDQTIRLFNEERYRRIETAENLEIYWKLRLAKAKGGSKKLFDAKRLDIFPMYFFSKNPPARIWTRTYPKLSIEQPETGAWPRYFMGGPMTKLQVDELVRRDGFDNASDMYNAIYKMHEDKIFSEKFFVTRFARKVA